MNSGLSNSSSDHDREDHPEYPHKKWILWLWRQMQEQGFYKPHMTLVLHTQRQSDYRPFTKTHFSLQSHAKICATAPSKVDFVDALLFIQGPFEVGDSPDLPINGDGPTRRWMQHVADRVVVECKHGDCPRKRRYSLVNNCEQVWPRVLLDIRPAQQPWTNVFYFQKDEYSIANCCSVDKLAAQNDVKVYGLCAIKDLLRYELQEATDRSGHCLLEAQKKWKR